MELLKQIFVKRWRDLWSALSAFMRLDTKTFARISDLGTLRSRFEFSALLFSCIVAIYFGSAWLINGAPSSAIESYVRATLIGVVLVALGLSPFALAFALLKRKDSLLVVNIVLVQQALSALVIAISLAIYVIPEPARDDFKKVQEGRGFGTTAYQYICGLLNDNLQMTAMNRTALARSRSIIGDLHTLKSWPSPNNFPSFQDWQANLTPTQRHEFYEQWGRRKAELSEFRVDYMQIVALGAHRDRLMSDFATTYPNVAWSYWVKTIGLLIVAAITAFHFVRSMLLQTGRRTSRWFTAAIVISAWVGSGLMTFLLARTVAYQSPLVIDALPSSGPAAGDSRQDLTYFEQRVAEMERLQDQTEGEVRSLFLDERTQCPDVDNHGLWPAQKS